MHLKPLSDRIIVEPIVEEISRGGIVIPERARSEFDGTPKLFRVIAIGPGRTTRKGVLVPIECAPGDRVLCHSYEDGPQPIENGQKVIRAGQILLVFPHEQTQQEKGPLCDGIRNE